VSVNVYTYTIADPATFYMSCFAVSIFLCLREVRKGSFELSTYAFINTKNTMLDPWHDSHITKHGIAISDEPW